MHQNHEEMELLKAQLSELEERQKNYDGLQKRVEEFEARERLEKLESDISESSPAQPTPPKYDPETQANIDNYLQVMSKYQQFETQIRQLKVKKANYQHSLDRAIILNLDEEVD